MKHHNKVKLFIEKNKEYPSEYSKNKEEKRLGLWIRTQKQTKKKNKLTSEKIKFLEEFPNWIWNNYFDEIWKENYNKIKLFIEKNKKISFTKIKKQRRKKIRRVASMAKKIQK